MGINVEPLSEEAFEHLKNTGMFYLVYPECDGTYKDYLERFVKERNMQEMKIKINNPEHSEAVQRALFDLGYSWVKGKVVQFVDLPFLYTYTDGKVRYGSNGIFFKERHQDEYILTNQGKFVLADAVIGLRPRIIFMEERAKEILKAMLRYTDAGKEILGEWLSELNGVWHNIQSKRQK